MKTAIIYASKYGHTEKLAQLLKEKLQEEVDLLNIKKDKNIVIEKYDRIILGSSVYVGKVQKGIKKFIDENTSKIQEKEYAIFLSGADKSGGAFEANFGSDFISKSKANMVLGHSLDFSKMNFFEKMAIKAIKKTDKSEEEINRESITEFIEKVIGEKK